MTQYGHTGCEGQADSFIYKSWSKFAAGLSVSLNQQPSSAMPTVIKQYNNVVYTSAGSIPRDVVDHLECNAQNSNILLPQIYKARAEEARGIFKDNLWIISTSYLDSLSPPVIDFVLACTNGPIGTYPVFIYHAQPLNYLTPAYLIPRITELANTLAESISTERVFSVFAVDPVARSFADAWMAMTGISVAQSDIKSNLTHEYYAALLTYCDPRSFRPRQQSTHPTITYDIRPAVPADIPEVAELCFGFAAESEPFTMSLDQAMAEARLLVEHNQVWVHGVSAPGMVSGIASICAVTRQTSTVAAITKVYTNPRFRRMGCAERLVRRVCSQYVFSDDFHNPKLIQPVNSYLRNGGKERIILYVAHSNPAAQTVYRRVGFVGLEGSPVPGVEPWLEIGFDRNVVQLGHW